MTHRRLWRQACMRLESSHKAIAMCLCLQHPMVQFLFFFDNDRTQLFVWYDSKPPIVTKMYVLALAWCMANRHLFFELKSKAIKIVDLFILRHLRMRLSFRALRAILAQALHMAPISD